MKHLLLKAGFTYLSLNYFLYISIILLSFNSQYSTVFSQLPDVYISDFKVNDDNLNSYQTESRIGVDSAGNFVIVWNDVRNMPGEQFPTEVYCQRFNKDGIPLGINFRIGYDTAYGAEITMLKDGRFVLVWINYFIINNMQIHEFCFQRFDKSALPLSPVIRVIDSLLTIDRLPNSFAISSDTSGNFIICWSRSPATGVKAKVYFQRYDSTGSRIGTEVIVNQSNETAILPDIAVNSNGSFIICWEDRRFSPAQGRDDIFMQRYNTNGTPIGNNVKVNDDTDSTILQSTPHISSNNAGFFVITWVDSRLFPPFSNIFYQVYNTNGNPVGANKKADNAVFGNFTAPRISVRADSKFVIGWSNEVSFNILKFDGRKFDSLGNPLGNQYSFPRNPPGSSSQYADDIYILGDKVFSCWTDNRNGGTNNYDIYCNVRGFQNPDTVIGIINHSNVINKFKLYPCFPNPFNSTTNIVYEIPANAIVNLEIFDVVGNKIVLLTNESQKRGVYNLKWYAENYSSGVYFVRLKADDDIFLTQKILLIK